MFAAPVSLHRSPARRFATAFLRAPFTADTWRRAAYGLIALPLGVLCVPLALIGGPAGKVQRRAARALLRLEVGDPARTGVLALVHAVLTIPLNLVVAVITGYGWSIVLLNIAYPARPLFGLPAGGPNAWGGPSPAGIWAFHAIFGGLTALFLMPWIVRGFTWVQGRLVRALLGR
jgi:hypothetical protein